MAFQVSPGVQIREFDLTAIVPAVSTTPAGYVGTFQWGPADQRVLINTEKQLETIFGKPLNNPYYATSWLMASNFLSYGGNLQVVRSVAEIDTTFTVNPNDVNSVSKLLFPTTPEADNTPDTNAGPGGPQVTIVATEWRGVNEGCVVIFSDGTEEPLQGQTGVFTFESNGTTTSTSTLSLNSRNKTREELVAPANGAYNVINLDGAGQNQLFFGVDCVVDPSYTALANNLLSIVNELNDLINYDGIQFLTNRLDLQDRYIPGGSAGNPTGSRLSVAGLIALYESIIDVLLTFKSTGQVENLNVTQVKNREHYENLIISGADTAFTSAFIGKYPGEYVNGCGVVVFTNGYTNEVSSNQSAAYPSWARNAFKVFGSLPTTTDQASELGFSGDEIHVAIVDVTGKVTGTVGQVIEYFEGLSVASDAKKPDGSSNYWISVINNKSQYIWVGNINSEMTFGNTGLSWGSSFETSSPSSFKTFLSALEPTGSSVFSLRNGLVKGKNSYVSTDAALSSQILTQYETSFGDPDESDVSILIGYNTTYESDLNDFITIAQNRKDCIAFVSACHNLDLIGGSRTNLLNGILDFADSLSSTSYGALDSGYKYQYDRFNNVYRYVPLCADSAGCAVRTDNQRDPWFSPAGYDRGRILNVVKLVFNPNQTERDELYKKNVNPVITSQGFGVILFGDKTLQKKPSAFDRINVRRLFNVLEKSIATAAKFQLFEFNDAFTRSQFKQLIEPFLRDIQGRRGITSYAVVCDESNNTPSIIDSNRFVADIFVAPNRSINFIQLNFVATPTGVTFAEYGG